MNRSLIFPFALVAVAGCATAPAPTHAAQAVPATPARLAFIEDDYANAVARARREKVPLFVDAWAPW